MSIQCINYYEVLRMLKAPCIMDVKARRVHSVFYLGAIKPHYCFTAPCYYSRNIAYTEKKTLQETVKLLYVKIVIQSLMFQKTDTVELPLCGPPLRGHKADSREWTLNGGSTV